MFLLCKEGTEEIPIKQTQKALLSLTDSSAFCCETVGAGRARPATFPPLQLDLSFVGEGFIPPVQVAYASTNWNLDHDSYG